MLYNRANHIYFLHCILQALSFLLLLNISACSCKQETIEPVATIGMEIPTTQLVGDEKEIKVHFNLGNQTLLDSYQLHITVIEQKTMGAKDAVPESQITYKNAVGAPRTFSNTYTGALSELINLNGLEAGKKPQVDFNLIPADHVVKLKLQFDLLQVEDNKTSVVTSILVQWILKGIIFNTVTDDRGLSYFTLQNLQEDIKDLSQVTVSLQSLQGSVSFDVGGIPKIKATLAELLPNTQVIAKDQETSPIKLMIDPVPQENDKKEVFSIVVLPKDDSSTSRVQEKQDIPELDAKLKATIKETIQEFYKLRKESKDGDIQDPKYLEELEDILEEETQHLANQRLEEAELSIKENKKKALRELDLQTEEALQGKSLAEQKAILKNYQQQKRKILLNSIKQRLKNRLEHTKGSLNALGHDLFFTASKPPINPNYADGQQLGHKIAIAIASVLAAIGSGFISVGVFVGTAGVPITLGTIETVAVPTILIGALLVSYSIFITLRAQKKLSASEEEYANNIEKGLVGRYMMLLNKIKAAKEKHKKTPPK